MAIGIEIKADVVLVWRFLRKGGRFQHLGFEAHQHRGRQKGLTGFSQVLFVAAAPAWSVCYHQAGHLNALAQLVEKTIHHGDHVHIPWVEIAPLRRVLEQAYGQSCASFSQSCPAASAESLVARYRCWPFRTTTPAKAPPLGSAN